jgi:rhomboid family protein
VTTYRMGYSLIPPVIKTLLIANGAMFLAELISPEQLMDWLALWPLSLSYASPVPGVGDQFWPWQLVTYAFLHGGVLHLVLNMYALWVFGTRLEDAWGSRVFAFYYFTCVIAAALVQLIVAGVAAQQGMVYPTIGASGGVFGLLLAFGLSYPDEIVMLVFPPVALKAKWFVLGYGAIELWAGVTGTVAGVAHFAHLGGMLAGYLLLRYWDGHPPRTGG